MANAYFQVTFSEWCWVFLDGESSCSLYIPSDVIGTETVINNSSSICKFRSRIMNLSQVFG